MSPTPKVLYPKLNSALSLLISLRYFQLNITIKPFYEGSKLIMRILGNPMIILISGSLPIENHCRLHQWEENKTWILREDVPIYLRTMILQNQIQYIFCCLERKNLLSVGSQHGTLLQVHTLPCMPITQPWCHGWNLDHI